MRFLGGVLAVAACCAAATSAFSVRRVVCHVDIRALTGQGRWLMQHRDLLPSLRYCTHLVVGQAAINDSYRLVPPTQQEHRVYGDLVALTNRFPGLNVLLSIGGNTTDSDQRERYLQMLESDQHRMTFVYSVKHLINKYGFNGVDLAWEFPFNKPTKERNSFGKFWHKMKKVFGYVQSHKDKKADEHRNQFSTLIHDLRSALRYKLLTLTIIPNINFKIYYDCNSLSPEIDYLQLMAFDYHTAEINPNEADYPAPLFTAGQRNTNFTVDGNVRWLLEQGFPGNKLVVGIPTFGRTWKLTEKSRMSGVPPIEADGPGEAGPMTKTEGLMAYQEICTNLRPLGSNNKTTLRLVNDLSKRVGSYAFRFPFKDTSGLWVGFETPDVTAYKADYVQKKGLGGIAFFDISLDDYTGICSGEQFPIVRAAKHQLQKWRK